VFVRECALIGFWWANCLSKSFLGKKRRQLGKKKKKESKRRKAIENIWFLKIYYYNLFASKVVECALTSKFELDCFEK
jgi:hypothetical protein